MRRIGLLVLVLAIAATSFLSLSIPDTKAAPKLPPGRTDGKLTIGTEGKIAEPIVYEIEGVDNSAMRLALPISITTIANSSYKIVIYVQSDIAPYDSKTFTITITTNADNEATPAADISGFWWLANTWRGANTIDDGLPWADQFYYVEIRVYLVGVPDVLLDFDYEQIPVTYP